MDLWHALGITPHVGIGLAVGGVVLAMTGAIGLWRSRSRKERRLLIRLND